jgi:nucleoside-diphosphate-sugar epimerase
MYDGSVIVLHPTIVLGNGGNWNRTIINNLRHGNILLPKSGSGYCNPVHVSDVCHAVSQAILSKSTSRYREYIVSSGVIMSWKEIYQAARTKLIKNDIQCGLILDSHDNNSFSAKPLLNFTYFFIYSSFGFLLLKLLRYLRPIKKLSYSPRTFPKYDPLFINEPRGVYRLLYSKKQIFSIERIQSEMDYRPNFDNSNKLKECLVVKSDQR